MVIQWVACKLGGPPKRVDYLSARLITQLVAWTTHQLHNCFKCRANLLLEDNNNTSNMIKNYKLDFLSKYTFKSKKIDVLTLTYHKDFSSFTQLLCLYMWWKSSHYNSSPGVSNDWHASVVKKVTGYLKVNAVCQKVVTVKLVQNSELFGFLHLPVIKPLY